MHALLDSSKAAFFVMVIAVKHLHHGVPKSAMTQQHTYMAAKQAAKT
jgi:hypothetical protein